MFSFRPLPGRTARRAGRWIEYVRNGTLARAWPAHSRLFLAADGADWALSEEARSVGEVARHLGIRVASERHARGVSRQSVMYMSQFVLLEDRFFGRGNRVAIAYYHGTGPDPIFAQCLAALRARHQEISRVQTSSQAMRDFILRSGIDRAKVFLIPIGIHTDMFPLRSSTSRAAARSQFGLPTHVPVVGSFQKDGVGWAEGAEPKLIKGPDVFVEVVARLRTALPDVHVLLSGPARGYVRGRLESMGVPYRHVYPRHYRDMALLYHALDAYVVTSREEGGPKAVLEAMASGVPLVSTRVGQAADLIAHGVNGWIADVDDVATLSALTQAVLERPEQLPPVLDAARRTAEQNSYAAQAPLWSRFFSDFVTW